MKQILVTGGAGFIGSNFIRWFLAHHPGTRIVNLDKLTYAGNLENLQEVAHDPRYRFIHGDITDRETVEEAIRGCQGIIHFAAESHVDRSIVDADEFLRTNVIGTHILLEAARRGGVSRFLQVSCYDEETRVLTREGLKRYSEVRVGEEALSLNPQTGQIESRKILKVIVQDYSGPMVVFKSSRIDLKVTPNHRLLYVYPRGRRPNRIYEKEAAAVRRMSSPCLPRGRWSCVEAETTVVQGVGPVDTATLFYLAGVFIGDGFLATQVAKRPNRTGLSREEYLKRARDPRGRLASGRFGTAATTDCICYRIFFDIPKSDKSRHRLEDSLTRLGIRWAAHQGRAGEHVYFSSREWSQFFEQFGRGAKNKQIPPWMLSYAPRYLQALLDGIVDSDGCRLGPNTQPRVCTSSFRLVENLCELGMKLGLMPRFSRRTSQEATLGTGRVIRPRSPGYWVFFRNEWIGVNERIASVEEYRGKVWCLKVEGNRNLVAERKGILTFCGNTDEVYGALKEGMADEEAPLKPNSPYAASKAAADHLVRAAHITYGLPTLVVRGCNNFGPHQFPEKFIPLMITQALEAEPLPIYGDGLYVREWIFVTDFCEAVAFLLEKGKPGEIYNVGSGESRVNLALAQEILALLKKPVGLIRHVADRPGHDRRYALVSEKVRALGWVPRHRFEEALQETIRWYQANEAWWRPLKGKVPAQRG